MIQRSSHSLVYSLCISVQENSALLGERFVIMSSTLLDLQCTILISSF